MSLQQLRDEISEKVVDLKVEEKRRSDIEAKIESQYGIEVGDIKVEYSDVKDEKRKLREELQRRENKLKRQLEKYEVI